MHGALIGPNLRGKIFKTNFWDLIGPFGKTRKIFSNIVVEMKFDFNDHLESFKTWKVKVAKQDIKLPRISLWIEVD